jgi:hypothetical protein
MANKPAIVVGVDGSPKTVVQYPGDSSGSTAWVPLLAENVSIAAGAGLARGPFLRPTTTMIVDVLAWVGAPEGFTEDRGLGYQFGGGVSVIRRVWYKVGDPPDTYRIWLENIGADDLVFTWMSVGLDTAGVPNPPP